MSVTGDNLLDAIKSAWQEVIQGCDTPDCQRECKCKCICKGVKQADLPKKSRILVCALARQFRSRYGGPEYRVFWKDNDENNRHFLLNELLFDVSVCSVGTTKSLQRKSQDLEFISRCHWQIESEFDYRNSRSVIVDMSKLVMGTSRNKLMIASHRGSSDDDCEDGVCNKDILKQCAPIADSCNGHVYFCFVAHPDKWNGLEYCDPRSHPSLYTWTENGWEEMNVQACSS